MASDEGKGLQISIRELKICPMRFKMFWGTREIQPLKLAKYLLSLILLCCVFFLFFALMCLFSLCLTV